MPMTRSQDIQNSRQLEVSWRRSQLRKWKETTEQAHRKLWVIMHIVRQCVQRTAAQRWTSVNPKKESLNPYRTSMKVMEGRIWTIFQQLIDPHVSRTSNPRASPGPQHPQDAQCPPAPQHSRTSADRFPRRPPRPCHCAEQPGIERRFRLHPG